MRLANVNNERSAPSPGLVGACPACGGPVIARCGSQRVHHWAHRSERYCDRWWEPETEWHRNWKLLFPDDWQEVVLHDERTEEKHIADVRTSQGLTIEFQHSHLRPQERAAREEFYGDMVWLVDGRRLRRDLPRFKSGFASLRPLGGNTRVCVHPHPEELFPSAWLVGKVPVYFDFGGGVCAGPIQPIERWLWCLLPQRGRSPAIVIRLTREEFVMAACEGAELLLGQPILAEADQWLVRQRNAAEQNMPQLPALKRGAYRSVTGYKRRLPIRRRRVF
jgi:competence protein CoiA